MDRLVRRAAGGERAAIAPLLEENAPAIRRRLAGEIPRRWRHVLSVDDVMQQTYIDAYVDIARFAPNGPNSFAAWLATLAQRNLLDALRMLEADRRGNGRPPIRFRDADESFVSLAELLQAPDGTPSRQLARREACVTLRAAVRKLPRPYRQVVEMYDLERLPVSDVAKQLQRRAGAVYMIRARAHRRLRLMLGNRSDYLTGG